MHGAARFDLREHLRREIRLDVTPVAAVAHGEGAGPALEQLEHLLPGIGDPFEARQLPVGDERAAGGFVEVAVLRHRKVKPGQLRLQHAHRRAGGAGAEVRVDERRAGERPVN